jgi:glycosyltransferase involved in cell wall biosynthesis
MKISIITVCYNSQETIFDTIQSVYEQSFDNIEYIVIDGGSSDNTLRIVNSFTDKMKITIVSETDNGIWDAMNKGINYANGDLICFLNSDDCFSSPTILNELIATLKKKKLDAIFGYVDIVSYKDPKTILRKYRVKKLSTWLLRMGIMPPHPGFICKADFFERYGSFKIDINIAPDFELMVRFFLKGQLKAGLLPKVVVNMKNGGISNKNLKFILTRYKRQVYSCRINGLWTTSLLVLIKYPYKFIDYLR